MKTNGLNRVSAADLRKSQVSDRRRKTRFKNFLRCPRLPNNYSSGATHERDEIEIILTGKRQCHFRDRFCHQSAFFFRKGKISWFHFPVKTYKIRSSKLITAHIFLFTVIKVKPSYICVFCSLKRIFEIVYSNTTCSTCL